MEGASSLLNACEALGHACTDNYDCHTDNSYCHVHEEYAGLGIVLADLHYIGLDDTHTHTHTHIDLNYIHHHHTDLHYIDLDYIFKVSYPCFVWFSGVFPRTCGNYSKLWR